jgi:ribosome-binding factor A
MRSYRVQKLASTIRDIVSEAIAHRLQDPRISPLTSVTRVEVSGDLQIARVYVSVLGEGADGRKTLAGLDHAVGRVQRLVAGRLTLRRCPELRFVLDDSLKTAAETWRILDQTREPDRPGPAEASQNSKTSDGPALEGDS